MGLIETANDRAASRQPKRIDYDEMNRAWPGQKRALEAAAKSGDIERTARVVKAAVAKWNDIGAWPDDWALFERTLNDMLPWHQAVDIRDL